MTAGKREEAEGAIRAELAGVDADATICPSQAARRLASAGNADGAGEAWRERMPDIHGAARAMASRGEVVLTRSGERLDPDALSGIYRIGRG